ncbi:YcgJ family protein [Salmonella enterica]
MRKMTYGIITAVIIGGYLSYATANMKKIFTPAPGILCDHEKNYCVDSEGISRDKTAEYLGNKAADRLSMHDVRKNFFSLSNGVFCSVESNTCFTDSGQKFMDLWSTRIIFSSSPDSEYKNGYENKTEIFFPAEGVVCDRASHFCADRQGISLSLTQAFLGTSKILEKILGDTSDVDLSVFSLSNGVYCDSALHKCYTDRFKAHPEHEVTRHLYK